jgi:hypothetical protein
MMVPFGERKKLRKTFFVQKDVTRSPHKKNLTHDSLGGNVMAYGRVFVFDVVGLTCIFLRGGACR